jgi:hypothetical protein
MKRTIKLFFQRVIPALIDAAILVIIPISFLTVSENASGHLIKRSVFVNEYAVILTFVCAVVFFVVATLLLAAFNKWNTIGKIVYKNWRRVILSFSATIVDFTCALAVTVLLEQLLQKWFYIETFDLLFVVLFCYALFSGWVTKGQTVGKYFFGITLQSNDAQTNNGRIQSLKYEMCKFGILIAFPYLLLCLLGIVDSFAIFLNIVLFVQLVVIVSFLCCKKMIWTKFSNVSKIIKPLSMSKLIVCFLTIIIFFGGSYTVLRYNNNKQQPNDIVWFGLNFPVNFPEYPCLSKVQPYADFMKTQVLSPKEYILNLFERYDIVILEEASHGESTQWELISDIVSDSLFINQVGNIFTEYGSAMHQNKIDTFLHTVFPNETELEKETAVLMSYMTGGFYHFIKNLNLLNATLPDSLKVKEHYCDNIDWDYFSTIPVSSVGDERDSMMAQVTIDWYRQQKAEGKRHKCLVVTNTRHAFGYPGGMEKVKNNSNYIRLAQGNQGQYIFEAYPDKTANVTRNAPKSSRSLFMPIIRPVNKGIWDRAFALNGNRPVGFDLKDTPFGNDLFNSHVPQGANSKLKYSDIFTGVIFDKTYAEFEYLFLCYPYQKYAIEEEARRKGITDINTIQTRVGNHTNNLSDEKHGKREIFISTFVSHGGIYFVLFMMVFSVFLLIVFLLKRAINYLQDGK